MRSIHIPRLTGRRRAGPRTGSTRRLTLGLAVAVAAAMTLVAGAHYAASAATDAPYGGTAAAVPGTVYAANYDTGGQGVAYNATSTNGSANSYRSDGIDLEATADTTNNTGAGAVRHRLDHRRAVVQLHRQRGHRGDLHAQLPGRLALRDHRRAAHRQRGRHQPQRLGRRAEHRRVPDLDHGHRQRHAPGRRRRR